MAQPIPQPDPDAPPARPPVGSAAPSEPAASAWTGGQYSLVRALTGLAVAAWALAGVTDGASESMVRAWAIAPLAVVFAAGVAAPWLALALGFALLASATGAFGEALAGLDAVAAAGALLWHVGVPDAPYGSWSARGRVDPAGGWSLSRSATLGIGPWWVRPAASPEVEHVFYDGHCGLCHRAVRFVLAEDAAGAFRLAPLDGATVRELVDDDARAALPDSLVARTHDGRLLTRSSAVVHILVRLGGLWRLAGAALWLIPRPLRDVAYAGVAKVRHRLFAAPDDACPLMPPELRRRMAP